jgi:predicted nucleic acid-binding protein
VDQLRSREANDYSLFQETHNKKIPGFQYKPGTGGKMKIYLDVCCLCRPFDDQTLGRIRLEVAAVHEILHRCTTREYTLVTSEAIAEETSKIPDARKRLRVEKIVSLAEEEIFLDEKIIARMHEIIAMGGDAMDSLHISCAERAGAEVLLTTDDGLITFFKLHRDIQVRIENPVTWLSGGNR